MKYFVYCLVLLAILVLPKHFLDTLNKNRISLILSKNISRKKFIIHEIIGVYSSIQIYSLSFILILLSVYINFHYFPLVLLFLVFSVPIVLTIIYTTIMLVVFLTRSYGFALIVSLIHFVVISPALESREIIFSSLYNNTFVKFFLDSIFYLLPQFSALISFSVEGFTSGMMTLVMCFSFFPLFGLFVLKFIKKDF